MYISKLVMTTIYLNMNMADSRSLVYIKYKLNSVVIVRKRTIPTERPQPAGEDSANF
jgi:hypothetical protein